MSHHTWSGQWVVHKFGGSSLGDADRFENVCRILGDRLYGPQAVVVSAVRGVTDELLSLVARAEAGDESYRELLTGLRERHIGLAEALLSADAAEAYGAALDVDLQDIADIARATTLMNSATDVVRATVSGFGEVWSSRLLAACLQRQWGDERQVRALDARDALVVSHSELGPLVEWQTSRERLAKCVARDFDGTLVITGYVARDLHEANTTLGRNGSDYSASIFGALFDASQIHIWTDVDGVMTADPRWVTEVKVIEELSYNEAMELAYFGAKVLHPQTMAPAVDRTSPIFIRNTFAPENPGTRIGSVREGDDTPRAAVKGITSISGMAVINLEGAGMIGVPGTAPRLFGALSRSGISVVMISQGSSEHSICFAVPDTHARTAQEVVAETFSAELAAHMIQKVSVTTGVSVLAVVGDGMAGTPGVAAKVFGSLGDAGVNVRVISQGSSERNISAIIDASDTTRALRAVHSRFYLSPQTLSIGVIGCGTVGAVLLQQIDSQIGRLRAQFSLDLRVRGIADSRRMCTADSSIALSGWRDDLSNNGRALDLQRFVDHVQDEHMPHAVIIDCTASDAIAAHYADWLARGVHVITPNKKAGSGDLARYRAIKNNARRGDSRYLYETTVGAGLPIIQTLRDLRETGDRVRSVQGILSGTLAYLFNVFDGSRPFSAIVRDALASGYTEPDPRDDLSGMDVARKLVILAREMGLDLELGDIEVESLVPAALVAGSIDAVLDGLAAYDDAMVARLREATAADQVLRYVAHLSADGNAGVRLAAIPREHTFAHINLTDNIVQFETDRYCDNPLVVQGPGAGPAVTAAGVFADLLRLSAYLGAAV